MQTPWGPSQTCEPLGAGVVQVTTASHGGIHLAPEQNAKVHQAWRDAAGWYEEDCDWAIVAVTFQTLFSAYQFRLAHATARDWMPDKYERVFGVTLLPAESHTRRMQMFQAATADKLVATAAWGSGQTHGGREPVPDGMVGVIACIGGRCGGRDAEERWFLVPTAEYQQREQFGFVVDEQRHAEWPAPEPAAS